MNSNTSKSLFDKAKKTIPGGVNSPVRAFKAVGGIPVFIKSAKGAYLIDEDNNRYIDLINSWGPMILGHAHELIEEAVNKAVSGSLSFGTPTKKESEIAELICSMVPSIEKLRMVNSGTEATMSAIRLARGFSGKEKIIKFEGCYHGHGDSFLIAAGSGAISSSSSKSIPDSAGITRGTANDTLIAPYNDLKAVEELISANQDKVAAIIVEPVAGNMGCVLPTLPPTDNDYDKSGFLQGLRAICNKNSILLIFDEVMTGFRLSKGGAQELFGIKPDLTTLGKIIGGGMPVGAFGGKKEIMDHIAPEGPVYQAGTLSGNPVAMAAGLTMLNTLNSNPDIYTKLQATTDKLVNGIKENLQKLLPDANFQINHIGSMFSLFFTNKEVTDFQSAKTSDLELFGRYFHEMLKRGVYLAPSQFESLFVSAAIEDEHVEKILEANYEALKLVIGH
ncbi:MAG: glutamate-1-semialdehyde-2,1-aminomutase [Cytophagales bacterium]|nr:glutamate-1-semialdehyde-2,1-aminomutase [Cytophagales bacterium]